MTLDLEMIRSPRTPERTDSVARPELSAFLSESWHDALREQPYVLKRQLLRHAAEMKSPRQSGQANLFLPPVDMVNAALRVARDHEALRELRRHVSHHY
jgi:hypothetical protein